MSEVCCCGNKLSKKSYRINVSPCRCGSPGVGPKVTRSLIGLPDWVSEKQYNERKRLGLPVVTDIEDASTKRWK